MGVASLKGAKSSTSESESGDGMVSVVDLSVKKDLRFKIDREVHRSKFLHITLIPIFPNIFLALVRAFFRKANDSKEWH